MSQTPNAASMSLDHVPVEDLNAALRVYRWLPLELLGFLILLPIVMLGLSWLSTALSPPYGVYILGQGLMTWGLLLSLAALYGLFWWRGRQVARLLNEPDLLASPAMGLLSGMNIIAERAKALGMESGGFHGPLRPRRDGR